MKNISPNVTIYKFPITAISSITNRATGLAVTGYFLIGGMCCLANYDPIEEYKKLNCNFKNIINYSLIFPITYHSFGGVRHFLWDKYPSLLETSKVSKSSALLLASSLTASYFINNYVTSYPPFKNNNIPPLILDNDQE